MFGITHHICCLYLFTPSSDLKLSGSTRLARLKLWNISRYLFNQVTKRSQSAGKSQLKKRRHFNTTDLADKVTFSLQQVQRKLLYFPIVKWNYSRDDIVLILPMQSIRITIRLNLFIKAASAADPGWPRKRSPGWSHVNLMFLVLPIPSFWMSKILFLNVMS